MQYILIENKEFVHLGPIFWRQRFIQSEIDDMDVDYIVSPVEPNQYVKINDSLEIYPVGQINIPEYDPLYEELSGPYWTFVDGFANGSYTVIEKVIGSIKNDMKSIAANERYKKEVSGISLLLKGITVFVGTDRESRNNFTQKLVTLNDGDTVQWKFPDEIWLDLTKQELLSLVNSVATYVQSQFDWEKGIVGQIDAAQTIEELKQIVIVEPSI